MMADFLAIFFLLHKRAGQIRPPHKFWGISVFLNIFEKIEKVRILIFRFFEIWVESVKREFSITEILVPHMKFDFQLSDWSKILEFFFWNSIFQD